MEVTFLIKGYRGETIYMKIKSVKLLKRRNYNICIIDDFSDELKNIFRNQLSSICYGKSKAISNRNTYKYENTVKEFLKRYNDKSADIKIGMIGELLTHILLSNNFEEFNTVSPYFNLEERSIKKGFDLVLYSKSNNELWITEVKSGQLHKNKNVNETNNDLLGTAKRDLLDRLNKNETSLWQNAINGANIVLNSNIDMKSAVLEILDDICDEISYEKANSYDKNVLFVSTVFSPLTDVILEEKVKFIVNGYNNEKKFKNINILSIQKGTYQKIVDFLESEANI